MSHNTEDWRKIWRKTNLLFQNWQEFGEFWSEHYKVSKICTLTAPFCAKYIIFDLKKYGGFIFHDIEESCKILRKTRLRFGKWHEDFDKFSLEHSKISKIYTLMSCFWPKYVMFELGKVHRSHVWLHWGLMQNLKENWLVFSKMTWRIWQIFTRAHSKV